MQTQINAEDGKIVINGPYSESNNAVWRSLGGKFAGGNWVLPDNDAVRLKVAEMFGVKSEECDVLVPYDKYDGGAILQVGGYVLAQRRGRDYRVQMPADVSLESGKLSAHGGSAKNPRVAPDQDVVFRLRCRKSFAEANGLTLVENSKATPVVEV